MLDRLDGYVQCIPHGDASPQNLLVPADDPETFVVIDVSFRTPHALGFDLGQLLVGLTHAGPGAGRDCWAGSPSGSCRRTSRAWRPRASPARPTPRRRVRHLRAVRSGFDSFLYGLIGSDDAADRHAFDERVALCGFLADQYRAVHPT